jgi:uncharacterized protein YjbJ (UPF0337 family)
MNEDRIAGSAKDFAGKTENAFGNVAGDAETQARGRAHEMAGKVQDMYGQAKDAARDAAGTAADYAREAYNNRGDALRDGSEALARKVRENPLGSLVTAGAVGFALALFMTRPARRHQPRSRFYS